MKKQGRKTKRKKAKLKTSRYKRAKYKKAVNYHFVFIEAPIDIVGPEAMLWGEAKWWPKKSGVRFIRMTEGALSAGTRYQQKISGIFGPGWIVEVTKLVPNRSIQRSFKTGMFKGYEVTRTGERSNGTRVEYELHYKIRNPLHRLLWAFCYRKRHDRNIKMVLSALKDYTVRKYQQQKKKSGET